LFIIIKCSNQIWIDEPHFTANHHVEAFRLCDFNIHEFDLLSKNLSLPARAVLLNVFSMGILIIDLKILNKKNTFVALLKVLHGSLHGCKFVDKSR
jgi:hypothetical protein